MLSLQPAIAMSSSIVERLRHINGEWFTLCVDAFLELSDVVSIEFGSLLKKKPRVNRLAQVRL